MTIKNLQFRKNSILNQVTLAILICSVVATALIGLIIANQSQSLLRQWVVDEHTHRIMHAASDIEIQIKDLPLDQGNSLAQSSHLSRDFFLNMTDEITTSSTQYFMLVDVNHVPILTYAATDYMGESSLNPSIRDSEISIVTKVIRTSDKRYQLQVTGQLPSGNTVYAIMAMENYTLIRSQLFRNVAMLVAIAGIFAFFVSYSISSRITDPLERIIDYIPTLSAGEFHKQIPEDLLLYRNETGKLAVAFEDMRTQLQTSFNHIYDMNRSLEDTVANRTAELVSLNQELELSLHNLQATQDQLVESQKQAAIGTLVRGVAHRMNTPLGNAITAISFLKLKLNQAPLDLDTLHQSVELIEKSLDDTRRVMDTFKAISNQDQDLVKRRIDLSNYLYQCMEILSADERFINYDFDLNVQDGMTIQSYPTTLLQVLTSLMDNVAEHGYPNMDTGSIRLIARIANQHAELVLEDFGQGIPKDVMPRIFEPFFSTKSEGLKSGLGLSIIYNQIHGKLKGTITSESTEESTRFIIKLPIDGGDAL